MKIIKNGFVTSFPLNEVTFLCNHCACVFEADSEEFSVKEEEREVLETGSYKGAGGVNPHTGSRSITVSWYVESKCPCCGATAHERHVRIFHIDGRK